jgi:hypothetical protein
MLQTIAIELRSPKANLANRSRTRTSGRILWITDPVTL